VANRYWAHFFGRGIVDPLDDMRVTNPPSNPELLDALADEYSGQQRTSDSADQHGRCVPGLSAVQTGPAYRRRVSYSVAGGVSCRSRSGNSTQKPS